MGISSWVKPFLKAFILKSCPASLKISVQNVSDLVGVFWQSLCMCCPGRRAWEMQKSFNWCTFLASSCYFMKTVSFIPTMTRENGIVLLFSKRERKRQMSQVCSSLIRNCLSVCTYFHTFLNYSLLFSCMITLQVLVTTAGANLKSTFFEIHELKQSDICNAMY